MLPLLQMGSFKVLTTFLQQIQNSRQLLVFPSMFLAVFPHPAFSSSESGFFNGMLKVFESGALNCYTLSCLMPWISSASMNPTITHLHLSGSLDSLRCDLIALTPGLAFFLPMTRTLAVASTFLSDKAYPSLKFLPPLSLRLTAIQVI